MPLDLTTRLRKLLSDLEGDIRERLAADSALRTPLEADYRAERDAGLTRQDFPTWSEGRITQSGVAWILATVFIRFLEDNALITPRLLEPVGSRTNAPDDRWQEFIRRTPTANRRDWMQAEFDDLAQRHPVLSELVGRDNQHLWMLAPSQDGITALLDTFSERTDDGTALRWSFSDPELSTRFLGDLYQDLSESARKQFALLQTPDFVERFILDRTLEPALDTFGIDFKDEHGGFRIIDPTVGSGHFLLGAFPRILRRWQEKEPASDIRLLVQRTLDSLHGTDINPFAVSIARFRLLIAAIKACSLRSLSAAPDFVMQLAAGDSLLLNRGGWSKGRLNEQLSFDPADVFNVTVGNPRYEPARRILGKGFHAVVGNPPYIQPPEDLNQAYRELYGSCSGKYALTCPFMERFVELALPAQGARPAGFVGKITSNAFMKREFGKKLITQHFAKWDLTHVLDTSGAYIPGHGTPTVILFLRNQKPLKSTVRAVLGIRGEPATPDDPSQGLVWSAILDQIDRPGSQSQFVSVEDRERARFATHPWSLSGGGAGNVKEAIERAGVTTIAAVAVSIGPGAILGEDDAYCGPLGTPAFRDLESERRRLLVEGDRIRDWQLDSATLVYFPYTSEIKLIDESVVWQRLWGLRTVLWDRNTFSKRSYREEGRPFWEYHQIPIDRNRTPLSIAFAFVATHNHFVLDRGGKVFNRTAPVIKLKPNATEHDHLVLLGLLNSSTIAFWARQVLFNKGGSADGSWAERLEWDSGKVGSAPIPESAGRVAALTRVLHETLSPRPLCVLASIDSFARFNASRLEQVSRAVALQEELDWLVYRLYGLRSDASLEWADLDTLPAVRLGERAFEIVMARKIERGELQTTWFERHGSTPITSVPTHWPEAYRKLVEARIAAIEADAAIGLIEQPEYKRRWNHEPWEDTWRRALTERLLDRIEAMDLWRADPPAVVSVAHLADLLSRDAQAVEIAEHLSGTQAPDMASFLGALLQDQHVPCAVGARYTESGMRKRQSWESCWDLQRQEDAIDALAAAGTITADEAKARKQREVGAIPVPPKYDSKDYRSASYWQARGKLDVAKERFISYPGASGEKASELMIGWAGWNHYQQAQALVGLIDSLSEAGASGDRLAPLLQGLAELLPWLSQWFGNHPEFGDIGAVYRGAWQERVQRAGLTVEAVSSWTLPRAARGGRGRRGAGRAQVEDDAVVIEGGTP